MKPEPSVAPLSASALPSPRAPPSLPVLPRYLPLAHHRQTRPPHSPFIPRSVRAQRASDRTSQTSTEWSDVLHAACDPEQRASTTVQCLPQSRENERQCRASLT